MTEQEERAIAALNDAYRHSRLKSAKPFPEVLYHYTTSDGLLGILSSGVLRGGHFAHFNDRSEITYGLGVVKEELALQIRQEAKAAARSVFERAREGVGRQLKEEELFAACFCEKPDLLSQWRAYGGPLGSRFCIGFANIDAPAFWRNTRFDRVNYIRDEQKAWTRGTVQQAAKALRTGEAGDFQSGVERLLTKTLLNEVCFFKDWAFHEEEEWRIVGVRERGEPLSFEVRNEMIRPFLRMCGEPGRPDFKLPIREIIVGASSRAEQAKKSANLLLGQYGYENVAVSMSRVPLRD